MAGPWASQLDESFDQTDGGAALPGNIGGVGPGPVQHNMGRLMTESSSGPYEDGGADNPAGEMPFADATHPGDRRGAEGHGHAIDESPPKTPPAKRRPNCGSCGKPRPARVVVKKTDEGRPANTWMIIMWVVIGVIVVVILFAVAKCFGGSPGNSVEAKSVK